MDKYKRDPNKDYKIRITISELNNDGTDGTNVTGEFNLSQLQDLQNHHIDVDLYVMLSSRLIVELEKIEAAKLGQIYVEE